jgi:hypothetical protein
MRYRDQNGDDWADIIDMLTMYPDARRKVARVLAELEASGSCAVHRIEAGHYAGGSSPVRVPSSDVVGGRQLRASQARSRLCSWRPWPHTRR